MSMTTPAFLRVVTVGLLSCTWALAANAVTPNRIAAIDAGNSRVAIDKTVPARARLAADQGEAAGDQVLSSVALHFNRTAAQQADLAQLLEDQQNQDSPLYRKWLTPAEFGARFGMSAADLNKVEAWLQTQGLSVVSVSPSSNYVTVSGTIAQINKAFGTSIHTVSEDGVTHISNLTDPTLPAAVANVVTGITGLNDFKPKSRARVSEVSGSIVAPRYTSSISGSHFIAPGDFYTIYNVTPLLQNSITGAGVSIAVAGQTDISTSDVAAFRSASGLSSTTPTIVQATGYTAGKTTGDIDEAQLDVEWSGAVAPGATIKFVTVGASRTASVMDALIYAITNRTAPIITISYGACEVNWGQANLNAYNSYFQQANAQGITIVGPSGDSGATDCDYQVSVATHGLAVDFPASSPYVTAAGGSMFSEGTGTYWNTSNNSYSGSAIGYIPEVVWNETSSSGLSAGGGGVSKYFTKPTWQIGTGVPSDSVRDVPDISLNSASSHDGYLFCSQGSCTNGYRSANNNLNVVGGTSVASPAFAGILALLEQTQGSSGLGNTNPKIYGLANSTYYGNVFHDITSGNNNSPCTTGTTDCPSGGTIGYSANTGYDLATGWGSIDAYNFVTKWSLVAPAGGSGTVTTGDFALASSSSAVTVKSGSSTTVTLTLTPASGFSGNVILIATSDKALSSTFTFSPASPVAVSANGSTSVSLNIAALQTSSVTAGGSSQTVVAGHRSSSHPAWYGAGSGAALACSLLFVVPRRRRWGALLAAVVSITVFTSAGCGAGGTASSSSSSSGSSSSTTTGATVGTYVITVTGTSGTLVHATTFTLTVTN
jgi:subtilase family serine protease